MYIIPSKVLYDNNLKPNSKILYSIISELSKMEGYCYATDKYLSELMNISPRSIQVYLSELRDGGYIKILMVEMKTNKNIYNNKERRIFIVENLNRKELL